MINNFKVEQRLGLRYYDGGSSSSSSTSKSTSNPQLTTQQLLQLYGQALPQIANVGASSIAPVNNALASSGLQQVGQYGTQYAGQGANIANINDLLSSGILNSGGTALSAAANPLISSSNPAQAASEAQATNLLNSINLNGLSGGEQDAVERSLNQSNYATGNLGLDNATNAVSNAMDFGNALQAKRAALTSALGAAQGVSSTQNNIFSPVSTALQNPAATNFGLSQFQPGSTLTSPLSFLSNIFSPLSSNASSPNVKSTSSSGSSSFNVGL
jgi:hypothetical protein